MRETVTTVMPTAAARGLLGAATARHDSHAVATARSDLAAANIGAAVLRETGKGYPITAAHAAALASLLQEVAK